MWCAVLALSSCGDASGRSGCAQRLDRTLSQKVQPESVFASADALDVLPAQAELLVSFKSVELISLMESPWIQGVDRSLATLSDLELLSMCRDSVRALGSSLCASPLQDALGIHARSALVVARHQGHWLWVFDSELPWEDPASRRLALADVRLTASPEPDSLTLMKLSSKAHPEGAWMTRHKGFQVLVVPAEASTADTDARRLARDLPALPVEQTWRAIPAHRALYDRLAARSELIVIGASSHLGELFSPNVELARRQHTRLFTQLDRVGLGLWRSPTALNRLDGELRVSSNAGEAVFIRALEPSKTTLPNDLGALFSEQTLGVMHAAVEPRSMFQMWRSALDLSRQKDLDKYLEYLKNDFLIDVDLALLDNLTGHLLLVIYDVQPGQELDPSGPSLFGLDATHEVLFAPIQDRFALEQLFNALTQLSRGRLRRQQQDGVIQYVWIEEGELLGAVLLGDEAMAIVDSAVSVTHAMGQLTSPQPLSAAQAERYGAMLSTKKGFGVWMNPTAFSTRFSPEVSATLQGMMQLTLTSYVQSEDAYDGTYGAQMSMTLATEEFEEPVPGEP